MSVFAAGFLEELLGRGYRPGTAAKQLQLMAHLSSWMAAHSLEPGDLRKVEIERFAQERRTMGRVQLVGPRADPLLGYLRGLGVAPPPGSREAPTLAGALLDQYAEYLRVRRGLAPETVRCCGNTARAFLADRERIAGNLALEALNVAAINEYLLRASRLGSVSSAKAAVTGLRSLLRFLHLQGLIDRELAVAVPSVAQWRLASLVKALDADSVARLLDSCDRSTAVGRRDFAILILLSRLGLRIGEVAALRLEHVDWRARSWSAARAAAKSGCRSRSTSARQSSSGCETAGRTARADSCSPGREPHTRVFIPRRLSDVVHRACKRAGLPEVGAHRLRHTAATQMLRAGTSLRDVGQVLRHRSSEITSIYAKVDRRALVALVQPWPRAAA